MSSLSKLPGSTNLLVAIILVSFGLSLSSKQILAAESLNWKAGPGYRVAPLPVPASGKTGFTLMPRERTGILFTNHLSYEKAKANQNLLNGSGLAAGDVDGDGWCDLYFCTTEGSNALYRNLGDWKFEDVTLAAGVACAKQASRAATFADLNGDGNLDLLVSSIGGPNACFLNDGQGHFKDVTREAGMVLKAGGHSYAVADIDGDGDLDVYLANYGETSILRSGGAIGVRYVGGKPVVSGRMAQRLKIIDGQLVEFGEPDVLYLNNGQAVFSPVSWTGGAFLDEEGKPLRLTPVDMGLSAMFRDINQDGFPDLYVCNDFQTPDRIWINDGQGKFRALPPLALRSTSHFSMGVDFADIDRDGWDDFFLSDMLSRHQKLRMTQVTATNPPVSHVGQDIDRDQIRRNTLFHNRGDGTYEEIAQYAGVDASDWTWTVLFLDVDLDGYEDLLVVNGHAYDTQDLDMAATGSSAITMENANRGEKELKNYPPLRTPNLAFHNRGNRTFEETGRSWGFDSTQVSHGMALADFDHDGDQDLAVSCLWDPPLIYRNDSIAPRLAVRLRGKAPNIQGIGARIQVLGGPVAQSQEIISGGRYLSSDDPMRVFAADNLTNRLRIEVTWRNGGTSVIADALPNHLYEIDESGAQPSPASTTATPATKPFFFLDVSERLGHRHDERAFEDYNRQPLLPRRMSHEGPGVAWVDLDQDGDEDLAIGAGKAGVVTVYKNDGKGNFQRWMAEAWKRLAPDDVLGLTGWVPTPGQRVLLAAVSNYESTAGATSSIWHLQGSPGGANDTTLPGPDALGPLACADVDGDGDLDVFAGGRLVPGRFPEAASSQMLINDRGRLRVDSTWSQSLQKIGLVQGAVFSDLNADGRPDLVLACQWGPVRVWQNEGNRFQEITARLGLESMPGLWTGVTTGDFDGDGQLDIVASNWGLNSSSHDPKENPIRLYFGDFDGNGSFDLIEAYQDPEIGQVVQRQNLTILGEALPLLRIKYPTHRAFAQADVAAILGDSAAQAGQLQITTLASMVFLNRGARFEAKALPEVAQYAPAFGVSVADLDNDGFEDIFLSQNFFEVRPELSRMDSGRGLWLRGNGAGEFAPVSGKDSGILIYGQQRGSALADFDQDGRWDVVVTQNGAATRLFRNQGAPEGWRIRLQGPPENPLGIGATIRLVLKDRKGPAREVHAGSGYGSQDGATQVFSKAMPAGFDHAWVRWPGGKEVSYALPPSAREIALDIMGGVRITAP